MAQTGSRLTPDEQTREDMRRAREGASIDVAAVRDYLYDGREQWNEHARVVQIMSTDPAFDKSRRPFMSRAEIYERSLAMTRRVYELEEQLQWSRAERQRAIGLIDDGSPLNLHDAAFEPLLNSQASPELLAQYGALIARRGIIGCYMQTELAHGSNVGALETTATFLPASQQFEIHSPTLTSAKWWNGALAKTATHGVVQAKLILGGRDMGPHLFFVQLRSLEDHKILPGIVIGDIGPKAMGAWGATDHGYARFDYYRIPRGNMLSKFAQVTQDGQYVRPPHAKISYGGMLYIRSTMVTSAGWVLAKAATASIRYATVRRQGGATTGELENQIITYPSVHYRLLPILARAYVFIQLGRILTRTFASTSARLAAGDTSTLAETHAAASGLKVYASTAAARDIETARRAMGGHGFSAFAGLGALYAQYVPAATYEGDNFVLDQQVVRAALKAYAALQGAAHAPKAKDALSPSARYLRVLATPPPALSAATWTDPAALVLALEWRAALVVRAHARADGVQGGRGAEAAGAARRVAGAVMDAFVGARVEEMNGELGSAGAAVGEKGREVLGRVYHLYLLVMVEEALVDLLAFGLLRPEEPWQGGDPTASLRVAIGELCRSLVPEVIGLTDAFGFSDWELDSALGVYDGRVYNALWERAQGEPLNATEVPAAYKHIKAILEQGQRRVKEGAKL